MSYSIDLYCRTCTDSADMDVPSFAQGQLLEIVSNAKAIADACRVIYDSLPEGVRLELDIPNESLPWQWLEIHAEHDLTVRDEYGRMYDQCAAFYRCPCCDSSKVCELEKDHEGGHARKSKMSAAVSESQTSEAGKDRR